MVRERKGEEATTRGYPRGSPQEILSVWDTSPHCNPEDVDALFQEIEQGKRPVRFKGVFDQGDGNR